MKLKKIFLLLIFVGGHSITMAFLIVKCQATRARWREILD
jgi:hypothetical protein